MSRASGARWLAIETSSERLSLAAGDDRENKAFYQGPLKWRHAETLFESFDYVLRKARWRSDSINGVAVSVGPGSFTGIRIGLAAARAFGQALNAPVAGISSLDTLASAGPRSGWISPIMDALAGGVYAALFRRRADGTLQSVLNARHLPFSEWCDELRRRVSADAPLWISGDAIRVYGEALRQMPGPVVTLAGQSEWYPDARRLLDLARPRLARLKRSSWRKVMPLYLRRPAAQERRQSR
jgi:tRNA threonylcarbamoyladenosine biosynthesis protein TsaB